MLGVDADGDGTVVEQFTLHVGAELSCADGFAKASLDLTDELLVERYGNIMTCGTDVARTIALGRKCMEGELADDEDLTLDVEHRAVHDVVLVVEDAKAEDLASHPLHILNGICCLETHQDEKSKAYF